MDIEGKIARDTGKVCLDWEKTTETPSILPLNAYQAPPQDKMCLFCMEDWNI